MSPLLIAIAAFFGVAALVGSTAMLMRSEPAGKLEDRLDLLTSANTPTAAKELQKSVLSQPLDDKPSFMERVFSRFGNVRMLFEQADTSLTIPKLMMIGAFLVISGSGLGAATGLHLGFLPLVGGFMAFLPIMWLLWRRKRRLKQFAGQLSDALDMLARSLRSGQSLQAGFNMVSTEMSPPVGVEFGRVFEEQNLGVPFEETLKGLTERVPNLDLKFFVTAVVLQRQTGGDLAEILDKIGSLIRERFRIWGQVQALTGEGRLSGVVLMALPLLLFFVVYYLNPEYVMMLFTDEMGKKMLGGAIFLQVLGALMIRKIVNIKV